MCSQDRETHEDGRPSLESLEHLPTLLRRCWYFSNHACARLGVPSGIFLPCVLGSALVQVKHGQLCFRLALRPGPLWELG